MHRPMTVYLLVPRALLRHSIYAVRSRSGALARHLRVISVDRQFQQLPAVVTSLRRLAPIDVR
jgi:hypothetical protein